MSLFQQVKFGNTGLKISPFIFGTMTFGNKKNMQWAIEEMEDAYKILKYAYDRGIRTFDTADAYANGLSETILGSFLKHYNIPRETVVIMTKVFYRVDDTIELNPTDLLFGNNEELNLRLVNQKGLSRKHILEAAKNSVRRLGTYIDVYQIHRCDHETPFEETMRALNDVVEQGYARYIGASSMLGTEFAEYQFIAEKHGWHKFVNMQTCYNLLYREDEREMLPFCKKNNVAITPWSPLQMGFLARPITEKSVRQTTDLVIKAMSLDKFSEADKEIIDRVNKLANKKNLKMATVTLAWLFKKNAFPIVGLNKESRIDDALEALKVELTEEEVKYLEEPYKPKPLFM
ncbi:hypothetical protein TBLA_0B10110 [Henningerozyma blattae CBS 6284]|uniref:NADP-dependent oxidoreductase domain-containing protein n=1 Tax=Henningerozyma blattae (strain ATCC 34711 / CBS 6284 / DSM 70876 / NBRC 10599 / NRRL Y-10934 / UCD 77-7) TaxID=1071380 RepID=I2H0C6_HENB6|nr:hypothetical protein TBLA_0B10110 [Tetrapisispora blattae CBS 6284]CCH59828.1 hypothetical protein TBLA_0B10110 [Tetrapisispora blattae CBS 6284]